VGWQGADIERLARTLAGGRGRDSDGDLVLAGRHDSGSSAGDSMIGTDQDSGADFGHGGFCNVKRELQPSYQMLRPTVLAPVAIVRSIPAVGNKAGSHHIHDAAELVASGAPHPGNI
jgi:hypothetical protein